MKKLAEQQKTEQPREETTVYARYTFSDDELAEIAHKSAMATQAIDRLNAERKAIMDDYKAKIAGQTALVHECSNHLIQGWEMRPFRVYLIRNFDEKKREYKDVHTDEVVKTESLTADDYQLDVFNDKTPF